jgi:hypothetical protein
MQKRRYYAEQLVWMCPGLDPFIFHALDFEDYIDDPVFQKVRSDERIVSLANAFRQYYRVTSFKDGLIETIASGGDIQGNCAICGAVLGSVLGKSGIPENWLTGGGEGLTGKTGSAKKGEEGATSRKTKERDQARLYKNAEKTAISLLASPVPNREYIDALKKNIEKITGRKAPAKGGADHDVKAVEDIRAMLLDKFLDLHYDENKWKYPIVFGDKKYYSYSLYEIATFATFITGTKDKNPEIITDMANDGYLNILVDRLNELDSNSRSV